ncbi:hypothetical protein F5Y16DRAFT_373816 [Xylariaceae sp. FL0255]|nr:hypothetical protein F5Y16DRAFT_373816 [Xylariaceae sp. FL0255]
MVLQMYRASRGDSDYKRYETKFNQSWEHTGKSANIKDIYLAKPHEIKRSYRGRRFNDYRGNKSYRVFFHGTRRACNAWRSSSRLRYCHNRECNLCGILWHSFKVHCAQPSSMFGSGIYSTPCSSKADIYAKNHRIFSRRHAVLICRVACNNPQSMTSADQTLKSPAYGYDSVRGLTVAEGGTLNYPEYVVYRDDAIIPIGVVFYTRKGWQP